MAGLTGLKPSTSYKSLLRVDDNTNGVDSTLEFVTDGEGTSTPLKLSSTDVRFQYSSDTHNIALGKNAGLNLASDASCILIGKDAGEALTGSAGENIFIGYNAGSHAVSTTKTVAIGNYAKCAIDSGGAGVYIGHFAGRQKQGSGNVAVGYDAMGYNHSDGDGGGGYTDDGPYLAKYNTGVGLDALFGVKDGHFNVAVGSFAGIYVLDGSGNTLLGFRSAWTGASDESTGSPQVSMENAVVVGAFAALSASSTTNEIVIGTNAIGKGSNKAVIGDDNITDIYLSEDQGAAVWLEHINMLERSSDPTEPAEGHAVMWMSNGSGKGDDGDVLIASQVGGATKYSVVFDHSGGSTW